MALHIPPELAKLAATQFGLTNRQQALEVVTRSELQRLLDRGVLVRVYRSVYRFAGSPPSFRQRARAACMAAGGEVAVSHLAAARLWEAPGLVATGMEITVPRDRRLGDPALTVHRLPLPPIDVTARWGIPVTTTVRLMVDLSRVIPVALLNGLADELVRARHLVLADLGRRLELEAPLPRHRRRALDAIVDKDTLRGGAGAGRSVAEDWVFDVLVGAGLPVPERNYMVEVDGRLRELDVAYPQWKIGIEYDGWSVHGDRTHFDRDRDKVAALQLLGWIILQVTSAWTSQLLISRVRQAIALRRP